MEADWSVSIALEDHSDIPPKEEHKRWHEKSRKALKGSNTCADNFLDRYGHTKGFNLAVKRILLIEDHAAFRQSLANVIDRQPNLQVVAQAGSLQEGISKASEGFDVAVVDLSMPDGDGVDLVGRLREIAPHAGVLGLSRRRELRGYARALEAGANNVVNKDATIKEVLGALEFLSIGEISVLKWRE